jgi:hypothetical protein
MFYDYIAPMNWQQSVSLIIVGVTGFLMLRSRFRSRKFSFERDTHCGCAVSSHSRPQHSVIYRARKGERPEIIVKLK